MNKIEINNVYILRFGQKDDYETYLLELDLMDNTFETVSKWEKFFAELGHGQRLKLTLEMEEQK